MQEQSLNQIMNEMAGRLDGLCDEVCSRRSQEDSPEALSEQEAFIRMDSLLASLNKQYLEAKQQRKELVALNGTDDAMAEVALDMEDSAWCAMQTRYIELREERELMVQAQRMMRDAEDVAALEVKKDKEKEFGKFISSLKIIEQLRTQERRFNLGAFEAMFIMLIFKMIPAHEAPQYNQQALAA